MKTGAKVAAFRAADLQKTTRSPWLMVSTVVEMLAVLSAWYSYRGRAAPRPPAQVTAWDSVRVPLFGMVMHITQGGPGWHRPNPAPYLRNNVQQVCGAERSAGRR